MTENIQILVVEDDNSIRNLISTTLKINGYRYETAATGEEALGNAETEHPQIETHMGIGYNMIRYSET